MFVSLPLGYSETVTTQPIDYRVTGLEEQGFYFSNGTETTTKDDNGSVTKTEKTTNFVKKNSDGTKETKTYVTEYDGDPFNDGSHVGETQTTSKYGKNGNKSSEETKEYGYEKDDQGQSWRTDAKSTTTTTYGDDGKPDNTEVKDGWGNKQEEVKYDKNGVKEESTTFSSNGKPETHTDYDAKGEETTKDYYGPDGESIVKTKDTNADGSYSMTEYKDDMSVQVETKFDKDGEATESTLHLSDGGKVKTSFEDGKPVKAVDYDENGKAIGVRYFGGPIKDISDPSEDGYEDADVGDFDAEDVDADDAEVDEDPFDEEEDPFDDDLDVRDMQADVGTQPQDHHY